MSDIKVRSHVARDLLQSSDVFKNEKLAVWEYVSNSLQYIDPHTIPIVNVRLDSKNRVITIQDNGRGMSWNDLHNYFVMHGENVDRLEGHPGRGRFGTGKSAAFGIGELLRITTIKNHEKSCVELRRNDLESSSSGDPVPVRTILQSEYTANSNGTLVEIEGIHLRSLDQNSVIAYIERQIARWPKNVTVLVNNHQCEFIQPPIDRTYTFVNSVESQPIIGKVTLLIKISKSPLDADLRGISIFSKGIWHETTLLDSNSKEMSEFLFGEIEVTMLDEDKSVPSPFDLSRSMRLNPITTL